MQKSIPILDICTLSNFKEDDILISRLSDYLEEHKNLHFPHRHSFFHLLLFTKGKGTHSIDFNSYIIQENQIYFMIPGQVHTWEFEGEMEGYVVNFSHAFFKSFLLRTEYMESFSFFSGNTEESVLNLQAAVAQPVKENFEELIVQAKGAHALRWDMIRILLLKIFILIEQSNTEHQPMHTPNYNYALLKNFQRLIEKNFATLKLPMEYAALLYITPNHLNALCKDQVGVSAGELIRNRIILEAKRLLINSEVSISDISNALNFNDNSYFTKFFKKYVGTAPEEFRKKIN